MVSGVREINDRNVRLSTEMKTLLYYFLYCKDNEQIPDKLILEML